MKSLKIIYYTIILLLIIKCDPHDGKLTIVNETNDTIFYSFSYNNDSISSYPINQTDGKDNYDNSYLVDSKSENHEPVMDSWEYFINTKCKDSTLIIFFFNKELIRKAGKDSIMKKQLYSKKIKLKVNDLEKLNWRVNYP